MGFSFHYRVRPENIWLLSMINIYRSMVGLVNVIFTISMVLLAVRFWPEAKLYIRILIAAGILVFPLFQPLLIYFRSKRIVSQMPDDLEMNIDNKGISVTSKTESSNIKFSDLKSVMRIRGILILYTHKRQGYILNKQSLNGNEQKLYDFLSKKVNNQ